jgi:glycosyltransferase involved in cell wall biosynthesis
MADTQQKTLKILFVSANYTPYSGGVVSSIKALETALLKEGHQVHIISYQFLKKHTDDATRVTRVRSLIRFLYRGNHMVIPYREQETIEQTIHTFQPDIIHVHHPFLLGNSAARIAKKTGIPLIFTHHTLYHEYTHYIPLISFFLSRYTRSIVARFCNRCTAIIAPSTAVQNLLTEDKVGSPIVILPSPIKKEFETEQPQIKLDCATPVRLLYVGRLVPEKNIPALFELVRLLGDRAMLTVVGYGSMREKLERMARQEFQLSAEHCIFAGKAETVQAVIAQYKHADIVLFPSKTDTQGLVIAEAFSQSRPVVALDGPGQRDAIVQGKNGFLCANVEEMWAAIDQIASDSQLYRSLQLGAWEKSSHYFASAIVGRLISVYNRFCDRKFRK